MTDLPFVSALVQADLPVWEQCLQTEFLQKMENGTLSEDCFKSYLVEDSLYLREYAKIFAWGMTKATTMAAMRTYYSLLSFVQENEDLTRLQIWSSTVCGRLTSSPCRCARRTALIWTA